MMTLSIFLVLALLVIGLHETATADVFEVVSLKPERRDSSSLKSGSWIASARYEMGVAQEGSAGFVRQEDGEEDGNGELEAEAPSTASEGTTTGATTEETDGESASTETADAAGSSDASGTSETADTSEDGETKTDEEGETDATAAGDATDGEPSSVEGSPSPQPSSAESKNEGNLPVEVPAEGGLKPDSSNSTTLDGAGEGDLLRNAFNMSFVNGETNTLVFLNGSLTGTFAGCAVSSRASSLPTTCMTEDVGSDRAEFTFSLDEKAGVGYKVLMDSLSGLAHGDLKPSVSAVEGRAAPQISKVSVNTVDATGTITVKYMCSAPTDVTGGVATSDTSVVSLHIPLSVTTSVEVAWSKKCGSGDNPYVTFGYLNHDKENIQFHSDGTHGESKDVGLEVSPHDLSTVLTMRLLEPANHLDFMAPYLTNTKPDDVEAYVRGARDDGTLSLVHDETVEVSVLYECRSAVRADITVTIGIPPWNNLTATWTKDCGGKRPKSLLVGTSASSTFDVLNEGELSAAYNVSGVVDPQSAEEKHVKIYDVDTHSVEFYLQNIDEISDIHIQSITITNTPSDILSVQIDTPRTAPVISTGFISKNGAVLERKESKRLSLRFACRSTGAVVVIVTLATLLFQNVEFGFVKMCEEGKVYHRSGLTAGSLLSGLFLAFILTSILSGCYCLRKRMRTGDTPNTGLRKGRGPKYSLVDEGTEV